MQKFAMAAVLAMLLAGAGCSQLQSLSSGDPSQAASPTGDDYVEFSAGPAGNFDRTPNANIGFQSGSNPPESFD